MEKIFSKENLAKLSEEVHEVLRGQNWLQRHGYEILFFVFRAGLFALGFFIFSKNGWAWKALGILVISYAFYGIGITGTHETRHGAFVSSKWGNRIWAYFFSDFWAGQSNEWWHQRHVVVHHFFNNVPEKEPKLFYYPAIPASIYFFVIPYLVAFWLFLHSMKFLWRRWSALTLYFVVQASGWLFHIWLFSFFVSWPLAIVCTFIMRSIFSPVFVHLAVFNHIGLEDPKTRLPWIRHQTNTTRNLKNSWFLNGMGGNAFVDCHIEHHLFPSISNRMLKKIRPIVKKYLHKEGYAYVEETYRSCLKNCIKHYHELFQKNPTVAL